MNTGTLKPTPSPLVSTTHTSTPSPTPAREASTPVPEVDWLADAMVVLTVEEATFPPPSLKRVRDEEKSSPQDEASPKWTQVIEDGAFEEVTPFIKILDIFSSHLPCTLEETVVIVSTSNLSFVQNLPEENEMGIPYDLSHNMFKYASIFSLVSTRHGDVLILSNPFKERDNWKEKAEAMELKCTYLKKELIAL